MNDEQRILVIEDDQSVTDVVLHHLGSHGFAVEAESDGARGLQRALSGQYCLVILDLNLPRLSGLDICKGIRRKFEFLPIIMLTARGAEADKVSGLELGADDYLVKPFSLYELTARVRARLRTQNAVGVIGEKETIRLSCGNFALYPDRRIATIDGAKVELTVKEFDVAEYLLRNQHRTVSKEDLLSEVWGTSVGAYVEAVTTLIGRLRKKLEAIAPGVQYILLVRGVGYRFVDPAAAELPATDAC